MSSTSSSSSQPPRTPMHERSDSEKNKLQIRMVPYSPPRPLDDEDDSRLSHADEQAGEDEDVQSATDSATITTPRTPKATIRGKRSYGAESSLRSPSFSTPISPLAGIKDSDVSGSKLASGSGRVEHTAPQTPVINRPSYGSNIRRINPQSQPSPSRHDDGSSPTWRGPVSRRENYINVHSDKTFSVILKPTRPRHSDRSGSIVKSPPLSNVSTNVSTISSHEETSFDASTEDRYGSPLSSALERSISPNTSESPSTITALPEELIEPSPRNYRMVGGVRQVPITPDSKGKGKQRELSESPLPPLPATTASEPGPSSPLATKPSFGSEETASTIEESTNYKVIGRSSPPLPDTASIEVPSSSSSANYKLLGQSSPAHTIASTAGPVIPDTPASKNYIVYGDTSSVSSSIPPFRGHRYHHSDDSSQRRVRERYSQESLLVPPLRPHKRSSSESVGYSKQLSGENLRGRATSYSSLSSVVSHDTGSLFTGSTPNVVLLRHTPSASSIPQSTWAESSSAAQQKARMDTHQWSTQLSTVMSEYEGSDPGSRGASAGSMAERVSSLLGSRDSRHMRSISSSLVLDNLETRLSHSRSHSRSHSQSDSLERPGAAYSRGGLPAPSPRTIRDHDEHGDGLADLQHLQHRSSRTRLGFSRQASDRSLRSSVSSRAGSLVASSFPTWARLYYSSPDRRWLAPLSRSPSEVSDASPWIGGGSPSHDYSQSIYNPRRRPREVDPQGPQPEDSMEIAPVLEAGDVQRTPKKKSSSLWSPHLRVDTRASNFSMWNTPSVTWSADSGVFGKRNIQVVLFVAGFLFPFAWMIAAFLPLPPKPTLSMEEHAYSTTQLSSDQAEPPRGRLVLNDDARYQSARWWRNINRFMAIAGLIIVGAVIALVVVGVREKWGRQ
ncbi:hypothetical protein F5Y11DRAFT_54220 [Daldinia sp. FL1419]|nr:hypothetical protein F5Y11DRAFT_54220 [Daldinia sp. FL1419]